MMRLERRLVATLTVVVAVLAALMPVVDLAACPYRERPAPIAVDVADTSPDTESNNDLEVCAFCANPAGGAAVAFVHAGYTVSWAVSDASLSRPLWIPLAPAAPPRA
jgi:hypothetical protein